MTDSDKKLAAILVVLIDARDELRELDEKRHPWRAPVLINPAEPWPTSEEPETAFDAICTAIERIGESLETWQRMKDVCDWVERIGGVKHAATIDHRWDGIHGWCA